jgi:hypothetical protein
MKEIKRYKKLPSCTLRAGKRGHSGKTWCRDGELLRHGILARTRGAGHQLESAVEVVRVVEGHERGGIHRLLAFSEVGEAGKNYVVAEHDLELVLAQAIPHHAALGILDLARLIVGLGCWAVDKPGCIEVHAEGLGRTKHMGVVHGNDFHLIRVRCRRNVMILVPKGSWGKVRYIAAQFGAGRDVGVGNMLGRVTQNSSDAYERASEFYILLSWDLDRLSEAADKAIAGAGERRYFAVLVFHEPWVNTTNNLLGTREQGDSTRVPQIGLGNVGNRYRGKGILPCCLEHLRVVDCGASDFMSLFDFLDEREALWINPQNRSQAKRFCWNIAEWARSYSHLNSISLCFDWRMGIHHLKIRG